MKIETTHGETLFASDRIADADQVLVGGHHSKPEPEVVNCRHFNLRSDHLNGVDWTQGGSQKSARHVRICPKATIRLDDWSVATNVHVTSLARVVSHKSVISW